MGTITTYSDQVVGDYSLRDFKIANMRIPQNRVEELSTSTPGSLGVLKKFNVLHTTAGLLYVKAGIHKKAFFSTQQPLAEMIAFRLGSLLGFSLAEQRLWVIDAKLFGVELNESPVVKGDSFEKALAKQGKVLVNVSRSFREGMEEFRSGDSLVTHLKGRELYEELCSLDHSRIMVDQMIVFDYIISNTDRHKKNFGFLDNPKRVPALKFSPLFDHGLSFASENSEEDIEEWGEELLTNEGGKPFSHSLLGALDYVDRDSLSNIRWDVTDKEIVTMLEMYKPLLGEVRFEFIKTFILRRYNYAKKILS